MTVILALLIGIAAGLRAMTAPATGAPSVGLLARIAGAVLGPRGAEARARAVAAIGGNDRPIVFLEDGVAIVLALIVVGGAA